MKIDEEIDEKHALLVSCGLRYRLCPLPYEDVLEDIIKIVWTEQCGYLCWFLEELRYLVKAALVCPG